MNKNEMELKAFKNYKKWGKSIAIIGDNILIDGEKVASIEKVDTIYGYIYEDVLDI